MQVLYIWPTNHHLQNLISKFDIQNQHGILKKKPFMWTYYFDLFYSLDKRFEKASSLMVTTNIESDYCFHQSQED